MFKFLFALFGAEKEGAKAKQRDITGDHYTFHSLPKEFQVWHNTHYILEKKSNLDRSTVPASLYNAYMWLAINDASKYAMSAFMFIFGFSIFTVYTHSFSSFLISVGVLSVWTLYASYHFLFYAKIAAQDVGPVTKKAVAYTSGRFNSVFNTSVVSLLLVAWVGSIFSEKIAEIIGALVSVYAKYNPDSIITKYSIKFYNFLVDIVSFQPQNTFEFFISTPAFVLGTYATMVLAPIWLFRNAAYLANRKIVDSELREEMLAGMRPFIRAKFLLEEYNVKLKEQSK